MFFRFGVEGVVLGVGEQVTEVSFGAFFARERKSSIVEPLNPTWRGRGLRKSLISRVIIGVTPFRVLITLLITLLITCLLSPLPLQVHPQMRAG